MIGQTGSNGAGLPPAPKPAEADPAVAAKRDALAAWAVPAPDPATTAAPLADDGTDQTAALQKILDEAPASLRIPKGRYRVDGPLVIASPLALTGEPGTVLDCSKGTTVPIIAINPKGTLDAPIKGVSITGITIDGPGEESAPAIIDASYLAGFRVDHCRINRAGYAGIRLIGCTGAEIADCVFDTIYKKELGYGIAVMRWCDRVAIRRNFFITRGRHAITIAGTYGEPVDQWAREVTVEDNYFENMTSAAVDSHYCFYGPYLVRRNVFYDCLMAVKLRGDEAGSAMDDNDCIEVCWPFYLVNENNSAASPPKTAQIVTNNRHANTTAVRFAYQGNFARIDLGNAVIAGNVSRPSPEDGPFVRYAGVPAPARFEVTENQYGGRFAEWVLDGKAQPDPLAPMSICADNVPIAD